jgi:hypothetical protein
MTQPNHEQLYSLLPSIYQIRDGAQGEPLRALLAIMEVELERLETNIDSLYDNWFIETCDEWVVPYIADLLDVRELYAESTRTYGQEERRAFVANTLAYRRRKGTSPVLEQLVRDVTGWRARAVEFFERLATTPNLNQGRRVAATVSLRSNRRPEQLNNIPFEEDVGHTTEVRRIATGRGLYNLPNIGLFVWRLQSYPLEQGAARAVRPPNLPQARGCYTFNPLGLDAPLFNTPETETEITQLADEIHVPGKLRRETLGAELKELRKALAEGMSPDLSGYFGIDPVFKIFIQDQAGIIQTIPPEHILITNLGPTELANDAGQGTEPSSDWQLPPGKRHFQDNDECFHVAIDPQLGRLALSPQMAHQHQQQIYVSYAYGFSGDIGGGPYDRSDAITAIVNRPEAKLYWDVASTATDLQPLQTVLLSWNRIAQGWQGCYDQLYLPLARLQVDLTTSTITLIDPQPGLGRDTIQRTDVRIQPAFQPGILEGLTLQAQVGDGEITLFPGVAINAQQHRLTVHFSRFISLSQYRQQAVALRLTYRPQRWGTDTDIELVPAPGEAPDSIVLGTFRLNEQGKIDQIDLAKRHNFAPGLVSINDGQTTAAVKVDDRQTQNVKVIVAPLKAINAQGVVLDSPARTLPLQGEAGLLAQLTETNRLNPLLNPVVTITLFVRPPIDRQEKQAQIEVIPDGAGVITLRDNRTYQGDWLVQMPADRSLSLLAASGYCPHLCGEGWVYAIATDNTQPGDLTLDGLLLEGRLTVLGGYLSHLQINHSTLVPSCGGLVVSSYAPSNQEAKPESPLELWMNDWAVNMRQLFRLGFNQQPASPSAAMGQLTQAVTREISRLVSVSQQGMRRWWAADQDCSDPLWPCLLPQPTCPTAQIETLSLERSICGPLWLGEGVSQVKLKDSLVDCGQSWPGAVAIAAPYSALDITNTTLLGTTTARILEACNSLFNEKVVTWQQQSGCLRFCYVPDGSQTPPRYRCQPDQALAEALDQLPTSITALAGTPADDYILVGTAGSGLFHNQSDAEPGGLKWKQIEEYKNKTITALLVTSFSPAPATAATPIEVNDAPRSDVVYSFAATADGRLYCSVDQGTRWTPLSLGITDTRQVTLAPFAQPASGQIRRESGVTLKGNGETNFKVLKEEDLITAWGQTRRVVKVDAATKTLVVDSEFEQVSIPDWTDFAITPKLDFHPLRTFITTLVAHLQVGTGQLIIPARSDDPFQNQRLLAGDSRSFSILHRGDAITIGQQTRIVVDIKSNLELLINLPFDLAPGPYDFRIENLFAGTAGAGVLRFTLDGNGWIPLNQGLTNLLVTAMAMDAQGHLFVGTMGGGVFRLTANSTAWKPINQGLQNLCVTALHVDANGQLLAGTSGSGLFALADRGNHWIAINGQSQEDRLTNLNITTITSVARPAHAPTASTTSDTASIESAPTAEVDIPPPTPPPLILVGTEESGLFRSENLGETWKEVSPNFPNLDVTALVTLQTDAATSATVLAGMNTGNLLQAIDPLGDRWQSINQGLVNVEEKLQILNRLLPDFTSTTYGDPGYGQLKESTAQEIHTGAEDGAELGTFNFLKQPQRKANLETSLDEYLRFGLEAGIFYET